MDATKVKLSGLWIVLMLIYLLGDVLRIYSGDAARMADAQQPNDPKWLAAAVIMLIPIVMVFASLVLTQRVGRWANIAVAIGFFLFVLVDIGSYPGTYDKFLLAVGMGINLISLWYAWNWRSETSPEKASLDRRTA